MSNTSQMWQDQTIDISRKLQKMNYAGGKFDQQERKNFSSKVNYVDANATTPPTSFTLIAE